MILSTRILGTTTANKLSAYAGAAVVTIGSDRFTRHDLASLDCFNFMAAQALSNAIATLAIASTRDLFDSVHPHSLAVPGIGPIAIAVLGACFERKGIGGDDPLGTWVAKHRGRDMKLITFDTIKTHVDRDRDAAARERRAARARKTTRRDRAHRIRVGRFSARQGKPHEKT